MLTVILAELTSDTALAAAIGAGVVAGAKVAQWIGGQVRRRNGGCATNGKPGYTSACVSHLERLAAVEVGLKDVRRGQERIEGKLDRVLEGR